DVGRAPLRHRREWLPVRGVDRFEGPPRDGVAPFASDEEPTRVQSRFGRRQHDCSFREVSLGTAAYGMILAHRASHQEAGIDADPAERSVPEGVPVDIEYDRLVDRGGDPSPRPDLLLELAGFPAGIADEPHH